MIRRAAVLMIFDTPDLPVEFSIAMPLEFSGTAVTRNYCRLVRKVDEYAALHSTSAIYSAELARACGVSARTLATAVATVRGMSLHRYLRRKKLYAARAQLLRGSDTTTVGSCARANGFHHMGEFANLYRTTFNETASKTLARARGCRAAAKELQP